MKTTNKTRKSHIARGIGGVAVGLVLASVLSGCGGSSGNPQTDSKTETATELANAISLLQNNQSSAARVLFEKVLAAEPTSYYAHYDLGVIDQKRGQTTQALQDYAAALTAKPGYVPAMFNEAVIYQNTQPTLAIATYRRIVRLQKVAPTAYNNLGLLEVHNGQPKQGVHDLSTAVAQDSSLLAGLPKSLQHAVTALGTPNPSHS